MDRRAKTFCEMYAFGLNGVYAAMMAGYGPPEALETTMIAGHAPPEGEKISTTLLASDEIQAQIKREKETTKAENDALLKEAQCMIEKLVGQGNVTP